MGEPVKTFVETVSLGSASCLDVPLKKSIHVKSINTCFPAELFERLYFSVSQVLQSEFVREFASAHRIWQILFVGKDQKVRIAEFVLLKLFEEILYNLEFQ